MTVPILCGMRGNAFRPKTGLNFSRAIGGGPGPISALNGRGNFSPLMPGGILPGLIGGRYINRFPLNPGFRNMLGLGCNTGVIPGAGIPGMTPVGYSGTPFGGVPGIGFSGSPISDFSSLPVSNYSGVGSVPFETQGSNFSDMPMINYSGESGSPFASQGNDFSVTPDYNEYENGGSYRNNNASRSSHTPVKTSRIDFDDEFMNSHQGQYGDCYALAAMQALKSNKGGRELLEKMVNQDENGNFNITLGDRNTFNVSANEVNDGTLSHGSSVIKALEKALAKDGELPYGGVGAEALAALSGNETSWTSNFDTIRDLVDRLPEKEGKNAFTSCFKQADGNVIPGHEYTVVSYNRENNTVQLVNPWDTTQVIDANCDIFMNNVQQASYFPNSEVDSSHLADNNSDSKDADTDDTKNA